jgi:hypothetical protein
MKKVLNEFVVARVMGLAFIIDIWGGGAQAFTLMSFLDHGPDTASWCPCDATSLFWDICEAVGGPMRH